MSGITVLMYHALEDAEHPAGARDPGEQLYVLQVDQFREQMRHLSELGLKTLLLDELCGLAEWPEDALVLTFDDGHESNRVLALPILQEYGFVAHFFITTGWIGTPNYLSQEQVRELAETGMGIGSHGVTHRFFDEMTDHEMERELHDSFGVLAEIVGRSVTDLSAPGGRVKSSFAAIAARLGTRKLCTSRVAQFNQGDSAFSIPRLAIRSDTDLAAFSLIVAGDSRYLRRWMLRNATLGLAKKIMGNGGYTLVRAKLLAIMGRPVMAP